MKVLSEDFKFPKVYYGVRTIRQAKQLVSEVDKINVPRLKYFFSNSNF